MNPKDWIELPYVQVYSNECKLIKEHECYNYPDAVFKRNQFLGQGKIAIIKIKKTLYQDYIPF